MRLALDTNQYVQLCRAAEPISTYLQNAESVYLPFVVVGELRAGFLGGSRSQENERRLIEFLNSPNVSVLFPDEQTTHHYARLYYQLRRQGTPIPPHDIWIAALVVQHDLMLCSQDRHFDQLPQLPRV